MRFVDLLTAIDAKIVSVEKLRAPLQLYLHLSRRSQILLLLLLVLLDNAGQFSLFFVRLGDQDHQVSVPLLQILDLVEAFLVFGPQINKLLIQHLDLLLEPAIDVVKRLVFFVDQIKVTV